MQMKTKAEYIKKWSEQLAENQKNRTTFNPNNIFGDILLDMREILIDINKNVQKSQEVNEGCKNCGLLKKYWDLSFCLEGKQHR